MVCSVTFLYEDIYIVSSICNHHVARMILCMCTFALSEVYLEQREGWVSHKHFVMCWQCPHEGLHLRISPAVCERLTPYSLGLHTVLHLYFSPNWEVMLFQYCFSVLFFNHGWAGTYFMFKGHFYIFAWVCVCERERESTVCLFMSFPNFSIRFLVLCPLHL